MANRTFSGARVEFFNLRERLVSDDLDRAQAHLARALAEQVRRTHLASADSSESAGKCDVPDASGTPPPAVVLEGLRFRPDIGSVDAFVEPGAVCVAFPDASPHPDDCPARLIFDPGVTAAGDLTLTPGSGSTRIDLVECQPVQVVSESDNRDVFDPATGLSSPVLLDKVLRGGLAYRIRVGTPGAGVPALAEHWLPLAVCSVPSSATDWDSVDVWDVRPLLADLADPPHRTSEAVPRFRRQHAAAVDFGGGVWRARGLVEVDLDGRRLGGDLATTLSGAAYLTLSDATEVQEPGFAAVASRPWYLYIAAPRSLPRWCKLSPATSLERTPQGLRGVPVFSQKAPAGLSGRAGSLVALPTGTGLGGSTTSAVAVLAGAFGAASQFCGVVVGGSGWSEVAAPGIVLSASSGNNTSAPSYQLDGNVDFPAHATAVRVRASTTIADTGGTSFSLGRVLVVSDSAGNELYRKRLDSAGSVPAGGSFNDRFEVDLELPPNLPTGAATFTTVAVTYSYVGASPTYSAQSLTVVGWRLGS